MTTRNTNDHRTYSIRSPEESDAQAIIDYSKAMFASTDQTLTTLEEYTITKEGEETWIRNFTQNPDGFCRVAVLDNTVVGLLFFVPQPKMKNAHTGEFGVSVHPHFQRLGMARALIDELLTWANKNRRIEKIFLQVFASNTHAVRLYTEMGFKQEGIFPKAIKQPDGAYTDVIQMYLFVR